MDLIERTRLFAERDAARAEAKGAADRIAKLEAALAAFHYYVCASDRELSEAGITREDALVRAYKLHEAVDGQALS